MQQGFQKIGQTINASKKLQVTISGAAGRLAYSLVGLVSSGLVFGDKQRLSLSLLDLPAANNHLQAIKMELEDSFPLLDDIIITNDPVEAFQNSDAAFLTASIPSDGMKSRKELLKGNTKLYWEHGTALNKAAKKSIKVCVIGNPANTNCYVLANAASSIPKENFTSLSRSDHNRMVNAICHKIGAYHNEISNAVVWGNHSESMYPDPTHAIVSPGNRKVTDLITDENYLRVDLVDHVRKRGLIILHLRSSAMGAAKASSDHMRDWWLGSSVSLFPFIDLATHNYNCD